MSEVVLETQGLGKIYNMDTLNPTVALKNINVTVHKGEFLGIMGPSGSGKSTFINMISTIDYPTEGKVFIMGKNVKKMSANEIGHFRYENLGFVFQDFNLLNTHTVFENMALPMTLKNEDPAKIKARVEEVASQLKISDYLHKMPLECSGGQRQRVAIGRALINNPGLIVADEPTGNLDSQNSEEVMDVFRRLNRKYGTTIVMVTHDSFIASYTDRLIMLRDGEISTELQKGDMDEDQYFEKIVDLSSARRKRRKTE